MRKVEEEETENAELQLCPTIGHWPCAAQGSSAKIMRFCDIFVTILCVPQA